MSGDTAASPRSEPPPARGRSSPGFLANLARRVATALVAVPLVVAILFLTPSWATVTLVVAVLAIGFREFIGLLRARGLRPAVLTGVLFAAALFLDVTGSPWPGVPLAPLATLPLMGFLLWRVRDKEAVSAAAATLLGAVYLGALGGTIAALRLVAPTERGAWRVLLLLAILMLSDSFAFFVGHALGRRRLAPTISPGKSVEGAIGGLLGGVVGALAVRALAFAEMPVAHAVGLGVLVSVAGVLGDLDESLLKRWAGVKDSGALLPGHGGMLDRLDSLLFGAPVLYYYFLYVR